MNRFIEHGRDIVLTEARTRTKAVDTPEDLAEVERLMGADDPLADEYLSADRTQQ